MAVSTGAGLMLVDADSGQKFRQFTTDPRHFYGLAFSPDGRTLAGPAHRPLDSTKPPEVERADRIGVNLWDLATGASLAVLPTEGMMPRHCGFTPDGKSAIVVAERRQRLNFLDPMTMKVTQ